MPRPTLLLLFAAAPAFAQELPVYLDDRSDAAALVASYYNAIARQEYARAWSYFGEAKPVADYAAFVAGYADTAAVELRTGAVTAEGVAGSLYETVPAAIAATGADGTVRVFAGAATRRGWRSRRTRSRPSRHAASSGRNSARPRRRWPRPCPPAATDAGGPAVGPAPK